MGEIHLTKEKVMTAKRILLLVGGDVEVDAAWRARFPAVPGARTEP
jgi:hypothetical protein